MTKQMTIVVIGALRVKKNISKCHLLNFLPSMLSIKIMGEMLPIRMDVGIHLMIKKHNIDCCKPSQRNYDNALDFSCTKTYLLDTH